MAAHEIDVRYIDHDLEPPEDQGRGLLEFPTDEELLAAERDIPAFAEAYPELMVPRSQWQERAERTQDKYRAHTRAIYSQGRTSACVGFGCAQAAETLAVRLFGAANHVQLAGMDIYSHIGRSLMSGAYIPDGVNRLATVGVLPLDTPENRSRYPHVRGRLDYTRGRSPAGSDSTARLFLITKWAKCRGADETFSALFAGATGVVGRSRHCVPYTYAAWRRGEPFGGYPNSWDYTWGDDGFGYDSLRTVDGLTFYALVDMYVRPDLEIPTL